MERRHFGDVGAWQRIPASRRRPLERIEWVLDASPLSQSQVGRTARKVLACLLGLFGIALLGVQAKHGDLQPSPLVFVIFALPIYFGVLGRFGRYFLPVVLVMFAYSEAGSYAMRLRLGVHFKPQIWLERKLTGTGALPSAWLQEHLYHGHTGPLEGLAVAAYLGHFVLPLVLATIFLMRRQVHVFHLMMYTLLMTAIVAMVVFVLVPTAPPWLADQHGYIHGVHKILKPSLRALHMGSLAAIEGDPRKYDVVAAVPSLHAAFAVVDLLAARSARLPRAVIALIGLNVLAVVFGIVYTGEHYVVDALAGALLALVSWRVVCRWVPAADTGVAVTRSPFDAEACAEPSL